jgi:hypothetical protein
MVAATACTLVMFLARAVGVGVHLEMMLGSLLTASIGPTTWLIGFVIHLLASGLVALIYAAFFEAIGRAGAGLGVLMGVVHAFIAGALFYFVPALHPLIPEEMAAPGPFMANLGLVGVLAFLAIHVLYGAIVGSMYLPLPALRRRATLRG